MSKRTRTVVLAKEKPSQRVGYDPDDPVLIKAEEESGLVAEYPDDRELLRHYMVKLLVRGWAGTMTPTEKKYVGLVHKSEGKYQGLGKRLATARMTKHSNTSFGTRTCIVQQRFIANPTPDTHPAKTGVAKRVKRAPVAA